MHPKKIIVPILAAVCFISLSFIEGNHTSGSVADVFSEIETSIAVGNSTKLSNHFNSSVELELPGEEEGIYSKSQAAIILGRFFDRYPPTSFKIVHKGNSAAGSQFAVGDYTTGGEKTFRVTIFLQKQGTRYLIQELEFE